MTPPLFSLVPQPESTPEKPRYVLAIPVKIAGREEFVAVGGPFENLSRLTTEVERFRKELDLVLEEAGRRFGGSRGTGGPAVDPDAAPETIWDALSRVPEEAVFMATFNDLPEEKRRAVAEHVLTSCNIFSGKAALFSRLYEADTARMSE
jgi:hypothetical protein